AGQSWYVYATSVSLSAGKTIQSLTLPNDGQLHLFALTIADPHDPLAGLRDNAGISHDSAPTAANIDGSGSSYSYEALQAAGVSPGGTLTAGGSTFTWPDVQPGAADNVVAQGQTIPLAFPPTATTLAFLGTAVDGSSSGTATITYTDHTTQTFTLGFPDWGNPSLSAGESIAIITTYRNTPSGQDTGQSWYVYATSVSLTAGKTLQSLTLPTDGQLHLFALTIADPHDPLASLRDNAGTSHDS